AANTGKSLTVRSRDTLVGVPDAAVSAAGTAACVATLQIDTDGPHADTGWIVPVGDASRAPIEWFTVPDGSTWDEWGRCARTGRFVRSGPTVTARLVRTCTATSGHRVPPGPSLPALSAARDPARPRTDHAADSAGVRRTVNPDYQAAVQTIRD